MDKINAYVLSGAGDDDVRTWLRDFAGADIVSLKDANLLVFVGGSDVTPALYGEENVHSFTDYARDKAELELFQFAQSVGMPMLGICRGSQFLHAAMGGRLWQDVTGHCCQHGLIDHETGDVIDDTTSTHHQMVRMLWDQFEDATAAGFQLIATPDERRSAHYQNDTGLTTDETVEVEVYRYDRDGTSIMGVQFHPEWTSEEGASWCGNKVKAWHQGCSEPRIEEFLPNAAMVVAGADKSFDRAAYQADVAAS